MYSVILLFFAPHFHYENSYSFFLKFEYRDGRNVFCAQISHNIQNKLQIWDRDYKDIYLFFLVKTLHFVIYVHFFIRGFINMLEFLQSNFCFRKMQLWIFQKILKGAKVAPKKGQ